MMEDSSMKSTNSAKQVSVFWDPGEKMYKISPATLTVQTGDEVIFHNGTKAKVKVEFLNRSPFGSKPIQIPSGKPSKIQRVTAKREGPCLYEALVDSKPDKIAAQGSKPIIIILR
jgi:plastocyanin